MVFGYGTHFWLEVPLVKLEGQVVILRLILERLRHLALDNSDRPLEPIPSTVVCGNAFASTICTG